ncbi:hypothetical protein LCGC14_1281850 [marine sediment metagenome]|uniref:Uncharacterized protein n=1 Tax=marine sediment metagenome TaxID=412755 RepID=A0A0F9NY11_9ZZZZ
MIMDCVARFNKTCFVKERTDKALAALNEK